ncbi:MAG TPA: 16S rRNA (guanine(966)-N(2))-methyltransferase RsmD [Acetobacteraceae bacterium]|nr:16S rRNA (guanine(966)-N(2))-methyltransferase RsmD [Acetobacteraceae bacterium]
MRIVAGQWRGRRLTAPAGAATRPTADRVRQALFDMLLHAPWGGREVVEGATVLDAFAGTGALGLEALSRGAATATFIERDRGALAALRANIAACRAEAQARVLEGDATRPPAGAPCRLIFLDPPYGAGLVAKAVAALGEAGWIAPGALILAELGRDETLPSLGEILAERAHGAARLAVWRAEGGSTAAPPVLSALRAPG